MARQIEREELVNIANGITTDVEELATYLNEVKALETAFVESWTDTNTTSKASDCVVNIQNVEKIVQNTIDLSQGVSNLYLEDSQTGGNV